MLKWSQISKTDFFKELRSLSLCQYLVVVPLAALAEVAMSFPHLDTVVFPLFSVKQLKLCQTVVVTLHTELNWSTLH